MNWTILIIATSKYTPNRFTYKHSITQTDPLKKAHNWCPKLHQALNTTKITNFFQKHTGKKKRKKKLPSRFDE